MSRLSDIVEITISRETQAIARASFGTPAIISEFAASHTSPVFVRHRDYADLAEMVTDGWSTADKEYIRAQKLFSQNPHPAKVMIGRKNTPTELVETWTEALTAIQIASTDWYAFTINPTGMADITFDIDFEASNSILATINAIVCDAVVFSADQETTMGLLKTEIEAHAGLTDTVVTIGGSPFRTMTIEKEEGDITAATIVTTLGTNQAVATIVFTEEDDILLAAAWAETQTKIFFVTSNDATIITSGTSDIIYQLKALNYDRSAAQYHPSLITTDQFLSEGWLGKMLPKDPGSATWMFKSLSGITTYELTSAERGYALGKNANIYTTTASVGMTEEGKVVSGEYIDIIRGIDWLEATISETIFAELINVDKIPYTNEGVQVIVGLLKQALDEAVRATLIADDYVVTVPLVADISSADKIARTLPDLEFTATLQGAIHKVQIAGVVTL